MIVVKVGGSLFDLPDLRARLVAFFATLGDAEVVLVPGGGAAADAVRALDATHGLGAEAAHWLALRACSLSAHFLAALLSMEVVERPRAGAVLDPLAYLRARPEALPASWDATSDSVAAVVAAEAGAELVLLKSTALGEWASAAREGGVDVLLPGLIARHGLRARAVDLRGTLGEANPQAERLRT